MKKMVFAALIPLALILTGCPYNFNAALTEFDPKGYDYKLHGEWAQFDSDGSKNHILVQKGVRGLYAVAHKAWDEDGEELGEQNMRAHVTADLNFINLHKEDSTYNLFKYVINNKESITLYPVGEDWIKKNLPNAETISMEDLVKFIKKNIDNDAMYEEPMEFVKVDSKRHAKRQKEWENAH